MSNITIKRKYISLISLQYYFKIIAVLNDIPLSKAEQELLSYILVYGYPKTREQKQDYYDRFKRSEPTINNLLKPLKEKHFIFKRGKDILIHPSLKLNTEESLTLNIIIENEQ